MRLVTYRSGDGRDRLGALAGGGVVPLAEEVLGVADMVSLLAAGDEGLSRARRAMDAAAEPVPLAEVTLLAPVPGARKLFALAGNYMKHVEESAKVSQATKATPRVFMKPPSTTLIGPGAPIVLGRHARAVDWEAELAVVIGRGGKYIDRSVAMKHVAGYACMNDVSDRRFRVFERPEAAEWDRFFDWLNGKWGDSFAPMGPALVTQDEIDDPHALPISLSVNGELKQDASTGQMIFGIATIIEFISAFVTLEPGDIIATGTPAGVGDPQGVYLADGDIVEVRIGGLGSLVNPVVTDAA
jgi:2-keto-4-pentenoate hydratase/2-oxohepta-3-ene-1,7-dioic acid hydratase in catechol pathway